MPLTILTVIANVVYCAVLNLDMYTDRAMLPNGEIREWRRSPISRLHVSGHTALLYLQLAFAAVSVLAGVLALRGVNNRRIRRVQRVSLIASTALFIIILIVTADAHVDYA